MILETVVLYYTIYWKYLYDSIVEIGSSQVPGCMSYLSDILHSPVYKLLLVYFVLNLLWI